MLLSHKDERGSTLLIQAVNHDRPDIVEFLLQHGSDTNVSDHEGRSALHTAVRSVHLSNRFKLVQSLFAKTTDVNARDGRGWTALHSMNWTLGPEEAAIAAALLDAGANPNLKTTDGDTPLHFAVSAGSRTGVELLISKGANVNERDNKGRTPLFACALPNRDASNIAKVLLSKGAEVNLQDLDGQTPLHHAAGSSSKDLIQSLLQYSQNQAIHEAFSGSGQELVQVLLQHGANSEARDNNCQTPLHVAAAHTAREVTKCLLEHGADPSARDNQGAKPSYLATEKEDVELAEALAEADRLRRSNAPLASSQTSKLEMPSANRPFAAWMIGSIVGTICSGGLLVALRRNSALQGRWRVLPPASAGVLVIALASTGISVAFYAGAPDSVQPPQVILKRYLSVSSWEQRLPYVRESQRVEPLMRRYYETSFAPTKSFSLEEPIRDSSGNLVFKVTLQEDKSERYYYLIPTEEGYKVDWEASAGHSGMSWVDFNSKKPPFPVRFRAVGRLADFYADHYSNGLKWICVQLSAENGSSVFAYAKRHSECGEKLSEALRSGSTRRLIVDLRFSEARNVEIVDLVAEEWVIPYREHSPAQEPLTTSTRVVRSDSHVAQ